MGNYPAFVVKKIQTLLQITRIMCQPILPLKSATGQSRKLYYSITLVINIFVCLCYE